MKTLRQITKAQLERMFEEVGNHVTMGTLFTTTHPKTVGKIEVDKVGTINGAIGAHKSEVKGPRAWGERRPGTPLVDHKGKVYVEMLMNSRSYRYVSGGRDMTPAEVEAIVRERPMSDDAQLVRDVNLDNINGIKIDGETYLVSK